MFIFVYITFIAFTCEELNYYSTNSYFSNCKLNITKLHSNQGINGEQGLSDIQQINEIKVIRKQGISL